MKRILRIGRYVINGRHISFVDLRSTEKRVLIHIGQHTLVFVGDDAEAARAAFSEPEPCSEPAVDVPEPLTTDALVREAR